MPGSIANAAPMGRTPRRAAHRRWEGDRMRRLWLVLALGITITQGVDALPVDATNAFAVPAFQQQWVLGESVTTNFWGPLATAMDGRTEAYRDAPSGNRTVQYFDKGRMEWMDPPGL